MPKAISGWSRMQKPKKRVRAGKASTKKPSKRRSPRKPVAIKSLTSIQRKRFVQRYFIDKFKRNGNVEWEIFTIEVRGTKRGKPLRTKKKMIAKVRELVR